MKCFSEKCKKLKRRPKVYVTHSYSSNGGIVQRGECRVCKQSYTFAALVNDEKGKGAKAVKEKLGL